LWLVFAPTDGIGPGKWGDEPDFFYFDLFLIIILEINLVKLFFN
jgi:hypothetical protein